VIVDPLQPAPGPQLGRGVKLRSASHDLDQRLADRIFSVVAQPAARAAGQLDEGVVDPPPRPSGLLRSALGFAPDGLERVEKGLFELST
jgi:hypothetical protein